MARLEIDIGSLIRDRLQPALAVLAMVAVMGCDAGRITTPGPEPQPPPPPPPGSPTAASIGICWPTSSLASDHVVYDRNTAQQYAKVRCAALPPPALRTDDGYCADWTACTTTGADGLTYVPFVVKGEDSGGHIRYNAATTYSALLALHPGGGGTQWLDQPPAKPRTPEWADLERTTGLRIASIRWVDTGLNYYISAGRFTRTSAQGTTFGALARRPAAVLEWIYDVPNPETRRFGVLGTSAGAEAALSPAITRSPIADRIDFLGVISYAPFFNFVNACNQQTPPDRFVDPVTGQYATSGAPATLTIGGDVGARRFPDAVWARVACQTMSVTPAIAAGSSTEGLLGELVTEGRRFRNDVFFSVATLNGSDNIMGTTWAAGGLYNHAYFASASRRAWSECRSKPHSHQLDTGSPCLREIIDEVERALVR